MSFVEHAGERAPLFFRKGGALSLSRVRAYAFSFPPPLALHPNHKLLGFRVPRVSVLRVSERTHICIFVVQFHNVPEDREDSSRRHRIAGVPKPHHTTHRSENNIRKKQIKKTKDEHPWVAAHRLLSTLSMLGFS